ncbi:alpha/beta hydrolase fold protein [Penicillium samsonianum]|uniref:alpha/beta hydrolase fold protein n=1 Tax=Penicillium samsonianum TaxID=1882272 RepID=UPI002548B11B|nr:alpha/beta hydrolase fold protein [Penicillium samsonianum]KAJ6150036.1 alpha/beta hydrolase fold protein [Penicillium samsonianum]
MAKFPTATNNIVDTTLDVFADPELTFDERRVAVGRYSAGGNLAISVTQNPKLQLQQQSPGTQPPTFPTTRPPKLASVRMTLSAKSIHF